MNHPPPTLHPNEIEKCIDRLFSSDRKSALLAFYGTGEPCVIESQKAGKVKVVPVESILDLRAKVPPPQGGSSSEKTAFLLPWSGQVPLDLQGRFVKNGHVMRIGREIRLQRIFRAAELDVYARNSKLADFVLTQSGHTELDSRGGRLTQEKMWLAWLKNQWLIDFQEGWALDTLLGFAAVDGRGPQFAEQVGAFDDGALLRELHGLLTGQLGPAASAIWSSWERGRGREAVELCLLAEALCRSEDASVAMWLRQVAKKLFPKSEDQAAILSVLASVAEMAVRDIQSRESGLIEPLLLSAQRLADEELIVTELKKSIRFPLAWTARIDELGDALLQGASNPSVECLERATSAFRSMEQHRQFGLEDQTQLVRRAEMAVRLLAWLVSRTFELDHLQARPYEDAVELGRWYALEGGYVDWARRVARGQDGGAFFERGVSAIVEACDKVREQQDRRFARALVAWHEAGCPASEAVPIESALKRIAVEYLKDHGDRRLLVVLFDGMGWAQTDELLQSLEQRSVPWGPVAWHDSKRGRIGSGAFPTVFASLPTLTEGSRAAFWAGKRLGPKERPDTSRDPQRFAKNTEVGKLFDGRSSPKLFLRSDGHTPDGALSKPALQAIQDQRAPIVGLVINAVDASLGADTQQEHRWTVDSFKSLPGILDAAREAGRTVLVASDHGNVRSDRFEALPVPTQGGARWRSVVDDRDKELAECEIFLDRHHGWAPRGAEGVVMICDDAHRYGGSPHAGEHGGATLSEVVVPCLLVGCADEIAERIDSGRSVRGALPPKWWRFEAESIRRPVEKWEAPSAPPKTRQKTPQSQLELVGLTKNAGVQPKPVSDEAETTLPLAKSDLFKMKTKGDKGLATQTLCAVELLVGRGGIVTEAAFAAGLSVPSYRVAGLVSKMQRVLNVDGFEVIRYDHVGRQVRLDVPVLEQQFEVKL